MQHVTPRTAHHAQDCAHCAPLPLHIPLAPRATSSLAHTQHTAAAIDHSITSWPGVGRARKNCKLAVRVAQSSSALGLPATASTRLPLTSRGRMCTCMCRRRLAQKTSRHESAAYSHSRMQSHPASRTAIMRGHPPRLHAPIDAAPPLRAAARTGRGAFSEQPALAKGAGHKRALRPQSGTPSRQRAMRTSERWRPCVRANGGATCTHRARWEAIHSLPLPRV